MRFVITLLTIAAPAPAWADWEYTRWDMTPEEVVAASKRAASLVSTIDVKRSIKAQRQVLAYARFVTEQFAFDVEFWFNNDERLVNVTLKLDDARKCSALADKLYATHGQPGISTRTLQGWIVPKTITVWCSQVRECAAASCRYNPGRPS